MMKISHQEKKAASLMREDEIRLVHEMLRNFSTWEPFGSALRKQLKLIGCFFKIWLRAEQAIHFFSNVHMNRVDCMPIEENEQNVPDFKQFSLLVKPLDNIQEIHEGNLHILCQKHLGIEGNRRYLFLPFSQHDTPFGQFILSFTDYFPNEFMLEKVRGTLNILQIRLRDLFYNHYPITRFTYPPSFQAKRTGETAILFCDVRDSTTMFEIARMAKEKYTEMLISLLKCFQEYASRIISVTNIGCIHRFMGDGFVATFGEYLALDSYEKARVACSLSLLIAKLLQEGFNTLWSTAKDKFMNVEFLGVYNEDIDLRLGIGLNYGPVRFDLFGVTIEDTKEDRVSRGYSEFTAMGDHMSFAQRLCSVANQPLSSVSFVYRSEHLEQTRLNAPIIASKTVTYWAKNCFNVKDSVKDPLEVFRTDFQLKGKGHPMPGFEIWPTCLNEEQLLKCIKDIHDNQFYESITQEIQYKQELKKVKEHFISMLNDINSE